MMKKDTTISLTLQSTCAGRTRYHQIHWDTGMRQQLIHLSTILCYQNPIICLCSSSRYVERKEVRIPKGYRPIRQMIEGKRVIGQ